MEAFKDELGKRNHRILHRLKLKWKLLHNVEDVAFVQERQNCLLAIKRMQILHSQLTNFTDNLLRMLHIVIPLFFSNALHRAGDSDSRICELRSFTQLSPAGC